MPTLSDGTFLYGSTDHPLRRIRTMSYSAATPEEAYREAVRRAHRYGGTWVVVPHPDNPRNFAVGLENVIPGVPVKRYAGPSVSELIRGSELKRKRK